METFPEYDICTTQEIVTVPGYCCRKGRENNNKNNLIVLVLVIIILIFFYEGIHVIRPTVPVIF